MAHPLEQLPVSELAEQCAHQTALFEACQANDPAYCYELLRRAVWGNPEAWEAVDTWYRPRLRRTIATFYADEPAEVEDLVQETLLRFQCAVTPERWQRFPNLSHLLAFLSACARNLTLNRRRDLARRRQYEQGLPEEGPYVPAAGPTAEEYHGWQLRVWACLLRHCQDAGDVQLLELRWVYGLTPQKIHAQYPTEFPSVPELYQRLRNLKERIGRDPECVQLLAELP